MVKIIKYIYIIYKFSNMAIINLFILNIYLFNIKKL